jgi:PiT family inorganic phosphate transporter
MAELILVIIIIGLALSYAYANGMNDAANAIALVISTRVMSPSGAIIMGAGFNMLGALTGTAVAKTIGSKIIDPSQINQMTVVAAILAAVTWVLIATRKGIPVSVSHSLVASVLGAGIATAGLESVNTATVIKVSTALALSPLFGFFGGYSVMVTLYWMVRKMSRSAANFTFAKLQIAVGAFMAYSHGKNDAQNAVGIMALGWAVYQANGGTPGVSVEWWMQLSAGLAMGIGTAMGGWKVIKTLGMRITKIGPIQGFAAYLTGGAVIEIASHLGLPVSTTHVATSSVTGVGASKRLGAVRWGLSKDIATAWLVTYPVCFTIAWVLAMILNPMRSSLGIE